MGGAVIWENPHYTAEDPSAGNVSADSKDA
jgi:hypothetical protein